VAFDPKSLDLDRLFTDPAMFASRKAWQRAGFDVLKPAKDIECMVAAHASAPGYLFKKYTDAVSNHDQCGNYDARIEGAQRVAKLIRKESLRRIVVAQKHLHELPRSFGKHVRVLVVERLDVVGTDESERCYKHIAEDVLRELLIVLVRYRGLDSNSKNVQFTRDGKIAFVDLENWKRAYRKPVALKSIGSYMAKDRLQLAHKILGDLTR